MAAAWRAVCLCATRSHVCLSVFHRFREAVVRGGVRGGWRDLFVSRGELETWRRKERHERKKKGGEGEYAQKERFIVERG